MVVIGEGEDHAYCQMGPYSYCCADYGQHPTIRCEVISQISFDFSAAVITPFEGLVTHFLLLLKSLTLGFCNNMCLVLFPIPFKIALLHEILEH